MTRRPSLRASLSLLLPALLVACMAAAATPRPAQEAPRLMVLLVVDQLRADLLTRYQDLWTGGFERLVEEGHVFTQASHYHAHTETAVGHTTLATGVYPRDHGVVANDWQEQAADGEWRSMYAVEDTLAPLLGAEGWAGRSPRNILRDGLADWVLAADRDARVLSVSSKDRSAIPMAGHDKRAHAYWILPSLSRFVTTTYYRDRDPRWVERFNRETMPALFSDSVWASTVPPEAEALSRPDSAVYEGDGVHVTFPHLFVEEADTSEPWALGAWIGRKPFPDRATLAFAEAGVEALDLGRRDALDFLAVSFSQVDYVGHDYGPLSREQLDNLLRLDQVVGELLDMLDDKVGRGRWVLAFSGDHGIMDEPEWRVSQGAPGYRGTRQDLRDLSTLIQDAVRGGGPAVEVRTRMARAAERNRLIERAYLHEELSASPPPDSFAVLYANAHIPSRAPGILSRYGIEVRVPEGTIMDGSVHGSTHLGPYWYDRWVPLAFLGAGVEKGSSDESVHTVDVAPTLARLAGLGVPGDLRGRDILR